MLPAQYFSSSGWPQLVKCCCPTGMEVQLASACNCPMMMK